MSGSIEKLDEVSDKRNYRNLNDMHTATWSVNYKTGISYIKAVSVTLLYVLYKESPNQNTKWNKELTKMSCKH